jgi:uncharacterized protein YeaO (DUF488 family)
MPRPTDIRVKRVYEDAEAADGTRYLVDRIWPRGISKDRAAVEAWLKTVAPSTKLRAWFKHEEPRWEEFRARYFAELEAGPEGLDELRAAVRAGTVTLVYSARDEERNQAVALKQYLEGSQ